MFYFVKTPWLLKKMYSSCVWDLPCKEKKIYLSFDDGPHPIATPLVLDILRAYNAKATFFCIGKNVVEYPDIYKQILSNGHRVGNHTHNHLNGWKVSDKEYFENIQEAKKFIDSNLFRPPYGRITRFQSKILQEQANFKIIMWDVLCGDFDKAISKEKCALNVIKNGREGSIIIFHDSQKALERMEYALSKSMSFFAENGYSFDKIS
jgi:peptidoglycan/xylan/chitin deacetylase (PgdA/CDA1 family)